MKVITKSTTPEGIDIQIEDWKNDYPTTFKTLSIGAYPIAKATSKYELIQNNKPFRVDINRGFKTDNEVYEAFNSLKSGAKKIVDYADQFWQLEHKEFLL